MYALTKSKSRLTLRFFGAPEIRLDDSPVTGLAAKTQAILAYLAMNRQRHLRSALAALLWGDKEEGIALSNLRKSVQQLRAVLADFLVIEKHSLALRQDAEWWADAVEFTARTSSPDFGADLSAGWQTVQLYQGDFLTGFAVRNAPDFESWMLAQQAQLRETMARSLEILATRCVSQRDLPGAIQLYRRLVGIDPWREEAHCRLMVLLAESGRHGAALHQYEVCCDILHRELGVGPDPATTAAYERLVRREPVSQVATRPRPVTTVEYGLVGRDKEWRQLRRIWRSIEQPYFVCIAGEAGLGKTRLAEELLMDAERGGYRAAYARAPMLAGGLAFGPVAEWLRTEQLQGNLAELDGIWLTEIARLLPNLLVERPELPHPEPLTENWQRKRLFEALRRAVVANHCRTLLVLDDIQWSDADTLEWLQYLVGRAELPLLIVGTVRREEFNPDHGLYRLQQDLLRIGKFTEIQLQPLTMDAMAQLANQVAGEPIDASRVRQLYEETAGNPLFVVEFVREQTWSPGSEDQSPDSGVPLRVASHIGAECRPVPIPAKVYHVIQSKLTQLSPEAQVLAHLAAAIGCAFDLGLLARAAGKDQTSVLDGLDELWQRRIICEDENVLYDFQHDLIRDVIYAETRPLKRRLYHRRIAEALLAVHQLDLDAASGQIAGHFQQAGLLEEAARYYGRAADHARRLYAHATAISYRQKAIQSLRQQAGNRNQSTDLIDLLLQLGEDELLLHGYGSTAAGLAWQEACDLVMAVGTPSQKSEAFRLLARHYRHQSKWDQSQKYAEAAYAAARGIGDRDLLSTAFFDKASVQLHAGNLRGALTLFDQAQEVANESSANVYQRSATLVRSGECLWLLGFPDQARERAERSVEMATTVAGGDVRVPLFHRAMLHRFCRDLDAVAESAHRLETVARRQDDAFYLRTAAIYHGWVLAHRGEPEIGVQTLRDNVDEHRRIGTRMFEPDWRGMLAEALLLAEDYASALREIDCALAFAQARGNLYFNAHLLTLRAYCLLAMAASHDSIAQEYQKAIAVARGQEAKSLGLRAAVGLCHLWQTQDKRNEAKHQLVELCGWFTEGFDTQDWSDAMRLLAEL